MKKEFDIRKFIHTTIREYLTENKYMDDVLDRMNSPQNNGKGIYQTDKEYLRRLKSGEDVSDIEQGYDLHKKMKDDIFKERPIDMKNWDFSLINNENPLWFDKNTFQLQQYRDSRFFNELNEKKVFLNKLNLHELEVDGNFIDELIDKIYFSETRDELEENVGKLIKEEKEYYNKRQVNGMRWVICDENPYPKAMSIGRGYTIDDDSTYVSCPHWIFKVVFK
jgi:hypothetical protein